MSPLVRFSRYLSRHTRTHFQPNQHRIFFSTAPDAQAPTRPTPPPIRVSLTDSAGRGVFATRSITAGELIHTAKPIVSHPSLSTIDTVCHFCLKKLTSPELGDQNPAFCSQECEKKAKVSYYNVETKADWSSFNGYCRTKGLKYPLMVKRLACMVISGAASTESLDILQPASLSRDLVLEMEEGFSLLRSGFTMENVADEKISFLTNQWYNSVLARIRINAFRIELAVGSYEDLLSSAAACVESEAAVGNAVYMLPSFYNHDCDPNTHIIWIENTDARLKVLRDVEPDEELRICYIVASMDRDARQAFLLQGFGFKCNCLRCMSGGLIFVGIFFLL